MPTRHGGHAPNCRRGSRYRAFDREFPLTMNSPRCDSFVRAPLHPTPDRRQEQLMQPLKRRAPARRGGFGYQRCTVFGDQLCARSCTRPPDGVQLELALTFINARPRDELVQCLQHRIETRVVKREALEPNRGARTVDVEVDAENDQVPAQSQPCVHSRPRLVGSRSDPDDGARLRRRNGLQSVGHLVRADWRAAHQLHVGSRSNSIGDALCAQVPGGSADDDLTDHCRIVVEGRMQFYAPRRSARIYI